MLFFDSRLSGDNRISCATCHLPDKAFGDGLALSPGAKGELLDRNTPTCLNVGFFERLFWDGRAGSLEEQALGPIQSPAEMNQQLDELEKELSRIPGYMTAFKKVFGNSPDRDGVAKALAAFQRTLVTKPPPFDRYLGRRRSWVDAQNQRPLGRRRPSRSGDDLHTIAELAEWRKCAEPLPNRDIWCLVEWLVAGEQRGSPSFEPRTLRDHDDLRIGKLPLQRGDHRRVAGHAADHQHAP